MESWILIFSQHVVTSCEFYLFLVLPKTNFDVICHDVHVHTLHLYEIDNTLMHASSRFELKISWRHTEVLMTKPLQDCINIEEKV
jgi:hypothetical protein